MKLTYPVEIFTITPSWIVESCGFDNVIVKSFD